MIQITEKQLIESLKQLKEIKPNKEWVSLLKSKILTCPSEALAKEGQISVQKVSFVESLRFILAPKKLVYSFAVILFLIVGVFGFNRLVPIEKLPPQKVALTNPTAEVIKDQISATAKSLSQSLKVNPVQDSQTMKTLVKTLADIPGDMTANPEVKDLMQTVVESQIVDLQKTTLTDEQKITLIEVEDLYSQGKYTEALEKILLINI